MVLFFADKIILDFKLFLIKFTGYVCPIFFIKLALQGVDSLQIRSTMGACIEGETHLRLDNFGKECRVPFVYTL